jgi:hypothetical protein
MTATRISQSEHAPPLLAAFEGNAQTLVNGDEFVGWGQQPNFTEFNGRAQAVFDGHFVGNNSNYRAYRFPWSAQPADLPAVSGDVGAGPFTTVHASWNGATDVAAWRVLAGASPAALRTVGTAPRHGFETAITVPGGNRYAAVQALDLSGRTLATSATAAVRSRIVNVGTSQFVAPGGQPGVLLACFGEQACTGQLTLSAGPTVLARRRSETISANSGGLVHLSLSNAGRSALAHARGRPIGARLTVADLDGGGESTLVRLVPLTTSGRAPTSTTTGSGSVHIFGPSAFVSPQGAAGVSLGCFGDKPCTGRMTVSVGNRVIGERRTETIGPRTAGIVHVPLSTAGQSTVRHAPGNQLAARVTVADADGDSASAQLVLTGYR